MRLTTQNHKSKQHIFQSTHPSGVRHVENTVFGGFQSISIHAPQWGATRAATRPVEDMVFQSTHPSGVRRDMKRQIDAQDEFQSTHPSGVRPTPLPVGATINDISIHAPQWGATQHGLLVRFRRCISIHAPQWGATVRSVTPAVGEVQISIHAPQWGATLMSEPPTPSARFQSTHPSGVRPAALSDRVIAPEFQSTHPSGVRPPNRRPYEYPTHHFNPRTPVGCDHIMAVNNSTIMAFQSTHPSGVRRGVGGQPIVSLYFNPRTPVGCDASISDSHDSSSRFQSTHPSGVRPPVHGWGHESRDFNPRTPVGCDLATCTSRATATHFNPRTPVGCDRRRQLRVASGVDISIHAPQWGATDRHAIRAPRGDISIHAPQWGATARPERSTNTCRFQSTHPSGVRPYRPQTKPQTAYISIHAPQWGATGVRRPGAVDRRISIHAPQWGATARMGIAFHNMEAPPVLKTDFIAKIHVHRSIHKFSNQKHQQTIHF